MGKAYATGKKAFGYCDRCGFRYPLKELKGEIWNRSRRGNRVCPECFDGDHPQNFIGEIDFSENFGLHDPRPRGAKGGRLLENGFDMWQEPITSSFEPLDGFGVSTWGFGTGPLWNLSIVGGRQNLTGLSVEGTQLTIYSRDDGDALSFQFDSLTGEVDAATAHIVMVEYQFNAIDTTVDYTPQLTFIGGNGSSGPHLPQPGLHDDNWVTGRIYQSFWDFSDEADWTGDIDDIDFQFNAATDDETTVMQIRKMTVQPAYRS